MGQARQNNLTPACRNPLRMVFPSLSQQYATLLSYIGTAVDITIY